MEEEKELIAIGIDIYGNKREFDCGDGTLFCWNKQLISLTIPEGVINLSCENNQLTELILPEGIDKVWCYGNQITQLTLPDSVKHLWADKKVSGLEKHIGKVTIELL